MTGVRAVSAMRDRRFWRRAVGGVLTLAVIAAAGVAVWYRAVYNVWPGQGASSRVHWCGRDYESFGGQPQTFRQISAQSAIRIRPTGKYPPISWSARELFAATAQALRLDGRNTQVCTTVVYLQTGRDQYEPYSLEGGP
jgi:hypothetical protein